MNLQEAIYVLDMCGKYWFEKRTIAEARFIVNKGRCSLKRIRKVHKQYAHTLIGLPAFKEPDQYLSFEGITLPSKLNPQ